MANKQEATMNTITIAILVAVIMVVPNSGSSFFLDERSFKLTTPITTPRTTPRTTFSYNDIGLAAPDPALKSIAGLLTLEWLTNRNRRKRDAYQDNVIWSSYSVF